MNTRMRLSLGLLAGLMITPTLRAQLPAAPALPTAPVAPVAPAAPANLWSFLCPTADQKQSLKNCFCNSPIGQLTAGAAGPMSAMSGGLITGCCPANSINNDILNKPATSSEGAAARIQKDEADAKARRLAVRYLGTVDCHYWPEATEALVLSLRKDPNECVRFEAALSLRNGCCCNEMTIKALAICVSSSDKDGAPAERSDRVRAAAADALARCPLIQKEVEIKEKPGEIKKTEAVNTTEFYARVSQIPRDQVMSSARVVLANLKQANNGATSPANPVPPIHQRSGNLSAIVGNAFAPNGSTQEPVTPRVQSTKQVSLYEFMVNRNAKQESTIPAEYAAPASFPAALPRDAKPVMPSERQAPQTYGPTTSTPTPAPRATMPAVRDEVRAPLNGGVVTFDRPYQSPVTVTTFDRPHESTSFVTTGATTNDRPRETPISITNGIAPFDRARETTLSITNGVTTLNESRVNSGYVTMEVNNAVPSGSAPTRP